MFDYNYSDGVITIYFNGERIAQERVDPRTQEPVTAENYQSIAEFVLDILNNDPAFRPDYLNPEILRQEKEQLIEELTQIIIIEQAREQALVFVYGILEDKISPVAMSMELIGDTESELTHKDQIRQRVLDIDVILESQRGES